MMSNLDRLVYMANQIVRNLAVRGEEQAAWTTADHIAKFWDPRMKAQIFAVAAQGGSDLEPIALAAVDRLRAGLIPHAESKATEFNAAHESSARSDAG